MNVSSVKYAGRTGTNGSGGIHADERALRIKTLLSMLDKSISNHTKNSSTFNGQTHDRMSMNEKPFPLNVEREENSSLTPKSVVSQSEDFELVLLNRSGKRSGKRRKIATGKQPGAGCEEKEDPLIIATAKALKCSTVTFTPPISEDVATVTMAGSGYGATLEASLLSSSETVAYNSPLSQNEEKGTPSISFASRCLNLESCTSTDTAGDDLCNPRAPLSPSPMRYVERTGCREFSAALPLALMISESGGDASLSPSGVSPTLAESTREPSIATHSLNGDDSEFFIYHTTGSPRIPRWQKEPKKKRVSRDTTSETLVFAAQMPSSVAAASRVEPEEHVSEKNNSPPIRSSTPPATTASARTPFLPSPTQNSLGGEVHQYSSASLRSSAELVTRRGKPRLCEVRPLSGEIRLEAAESHAASFYSLLNQYNRCRHNNSDSGVHASCVSETLSVGNSLCSIAPRNAASHLDCANSRGSIAYTQLSTLSTRQGVADSTRCTPLPPSHCPSHRSSQILALAQLGIPISSRPIIRSPNSKIYSNPPDSLSQADSALGLSVKEANHVHDDELPAASTPQPDSPHSSAASTWFVDTDLDGEEEDFADVDEEHGFDEEVVDSEKNEKVRSEFSYETTSDTSDAESKESRATTVDSDTMKIGKEESCVHHPTQDELEDGPVLFSTAAMPTVRPNHYEPGPQRRARSRTDVSPYSGIMRGRRTTSQQSIITTTSFAINTPVPLTSLLNETTAGAMEMVSGTKEEGDVAEEGDEVMEATMSRVLLHVERSEMNSNELHEEYVTQEIPSDAPSKDSWSERLVNYCTAARNLLLVASAERSISDQPLLYDDAFMADVIPFGRTMTNLMRLVKLQRTSSEAPQWIASSPVASASEMSSLHFPECGESETVDEALFTRAKESCADLIRKEQMIAALQEFFAVLDRVEVEIEEAQRVKSASLANRCRGDNKIVDVVSALLKAFREQITLHIECLLLHAIAQRYPNCIVHNSDTQARRIRAVTTSICSLALSQLGSSYGSCVDQPTSPRAHDTHSKAWVRSRILTILFSTLSDASSDGCWAYGALAERDEKEDAMTAFIALRNYLEKSLLGEQVTRQADASEDDGKENHASRVKDVHFDDKPPDADSNAVASESACDVWIRVQEDLRNVLVSGTRSLSTPSSPRIVPETYGDAALAQCRKNDVEWAEEVLADCMACVPRAQVSKRSFSLSEMDSERQQHLWFSILELVHELLLTQPYGTSSKRESHQGTYLLNTHSMSIGSSRSNSPEDTTLTVDQLLQTRIAERRMCIDCYCKSIRKLSIELSEWIALWMLPSSPGTSGSPFTFLEHIRTLKRFLLGDIQMREERRQKSAWVLKTDCAVAEAVKQVVVSWRATADRSDGSSERESGTPTEQLVTSFLSMMNSPEHLEYGTQMEELSQQLSALAIESLHSIHERPESVDASSLLLLSPPRKGTTLLQSAVEQVVAQQRMLLAQLEESATFLGSQQQQTPLRSSEAVGLDTFASVMKTPPSATLLANSFLVTDSRIASPDPSPFPSSASKMRSRTLQLSDARHDRTAAASAHRFLAKLASTCVHELECCGFPLLRKNSSHKKEKLCTISASSCHTYLTVIPLRELPNSEEAILSDCIADEITSDSTVIRVDDMERVTCGVVKRGTLVLPCLRVVVRARQSLFSSLSSPGGEASTTTETYEWTFLSVEHAQSVLLALPQLHQNRL